MVPDTRVISNSETRNPIECNQKNKAYASELNSAFSAETCRELFETLAQWNTYLEDHVPYFQNQIQEPTP